MHHTVAYLHFNVPEFIRTRKLVAEQSRSKSRELFSMDSVVADGVTSQNFKH